MKRFIPSKTLTTRATDPPWWTPECSSAIQQKDKAWKRHTRHRHSAEQLNAYKCATAATDRVLRQAKAAHTASIRRKVLQGGLTSRQWWSTIKQAGGQGRSQGFPIMVNAAGTECVTSREKAECFAQHFSRKCSLDQDLTEDSMPRVQRRSQEAAS